MKDEYGPRLAATTERRDGRPDRRVTIPTDWPAARDTIEAELREAWSAIRGMSDDVHAIRGLLERLAWKQGVLWAAGIVVASAVVSGGFYLMTRHLDRALSGAVADERAERVEAIADVLRDIPATPSLRLQTGSRRGSPTVAAVQARLPTVRGITARERDAACVRVPDACGPP